MDINKQIGKRIRELRKEQGISQEYLASQVDIHEDYVGKIERGERYPSINRLNSIVKILNCTLSKFFEGIE